MTQDCVCTFCESLPSVAHQTWGGRPSKCPLCKQNLWVTQEGTTCRINSTLAVSSANQWYWTTGLSTVLLLCLAVVAFYSFARKTGERHAALATPIVDTGLNRGNRSERSTVDLPGPDVRAKPGRTVAAVRIKPVVMAAPQRSVEPVKVATSSMAAEEAVSIKPKRSAPPSLQTASFEREEYLHAELRFVPEVDFDPDYLKKSKDEIAQTAREIVKVSKDNKDAFPRQLMKERADLAGLPFLLGKDCALDAQQAQALARGSLDIRAALAFAFANSSHRSKSYPSYVNQPIPDPTVVTFWNRFISRSPTDDWHNPGNLQALQQILSAEHKDFRLRLVEHLQSIKDVKASEMLANRAVFDLNAEVREAAVRQLRDRPKDEYRATLVRALRYPWESVVRHAAQTLAALEYRELIPDLVAMLDEPDPKAPYAVPAENGKQKMVIRELVRINHHRNCMLCHAPMSEAEVTNRRLAVPVGPVPPSQEPLPPTSSVVYYSARRGAAVVRADITYLRQDFSIQQQVINQGKWPEIQRFDFLVRTRELKPQELVEQAPPIISEYQETIASALRSLTGKDAAPSARAWREALGLLHPIVQAKRIHAR